MLVEMMKGWTNRKVHEQGINASTSRFAMKGWKSGINYSKSEVKVTLQSVMRLPPSYGLCAFVPRRFF